MMEVEGGRMSREGEEERISDAFHSSYPDSLGAISEFDISRRYPSPDTHPRTSKGFRYQVVKASADGEFQCLPSHPFEQKKNDLTSGY